MPFSQETQDLIDQAEGTLSLVLSTRNQAKEDAGKAKAAAETATASAGESRQAVTMHQEALTAALDAIRTELTPPAEEMPVAAANRSNRTQAGTTRVSGG